MHQDYIYSFVSYDFMDYFQLFLCKYFNNVIESCPSERDFRHVEAVLY